jgi:hypothetical protein
MYEVVGQPNAGDLGRIDRVRVGDLPGRQRGNDRRPVPQPAGCADLDELRIQQYVDLGRPSHLR